MNRGFRLDVYNVIILALIPAVVGIAWFAGKTYDERELRQACEETSTFLDEAAAIYPDYVDSPTIGQVNPWLDKHRQLYKPWPVWSLQDTVDKTVSWAYDYDPEFLTTDTPGELWDELPSFHTQLIDGRDKLLSNCPGLEDQIIAAWPMIFTKDNIDDTVIGPNTNGQ